MRKTAFLWTVLLCFLAGSVQAFELKEWGRQTWEDAKYVWRSDHYDAYVPFYAWHNRLAYDDEHISKYNEAALGFGLGKSVYDEKGNWYGLYAFAFKDSNYKLETVAGFAYQKNWALDCSGDWKAGIGYTIGMTQRHEYAYIPIPMPLPIAGIEYKKLAFHLAYVPGMKNFGNVALFFARINLY